MGFMPISLWGYFYKRKSIKEELKDPNVVICESIADFNMWIDG